MKVAILGAGGVGAYYGGLLARAGNAVVLLARGPNLDALRDRGLEVRTPDGAFIAAVEAVGDGKRDQGRRPRDRCREGLLAR